MKRKRQVTKSWRTQLSNAEREINSIKNTHQKTGEFSYKQPKLPSKQLKDEENKCKAKRRQEV